jgi:hypothetical protein
MATQQASGTKAPSTPAASGAKARVRKTPQEARAATVKRVRDNVGKAVAQLQSAEIRRTGKLSGNADLVAAYEAFDAQLVKIAAVSDAAAAAPQA